LGYYLNFNNEVIMIDWTDPKDKISKYFTVKEAIWLDKWNRLANESDGLNDHVKSSLVHVFTTMMDPIREKINKVIYIKSAYRPKAYNVAIGGATYSCHMYLEPNIGAVDWWTDENDDGKMDGKDCDLLKTIMRPIIVEMNIRMEDNGVGATWIHNDNKPVPAGGHREFKP
jgi:hypothetical protein